MTDNTPCPLNGGEGCKVATKNSKPKDSACEVCEIKNAWGGNEDVYIVRKKWLKKCGLPETDAKKPNKL